MGEFEYSSSKTTALVHFQAHKFPYTSSVYYQCNVRLCIRHAGGCDDTVRRSNSPPRLVSRFANRTRSQFSPFLNFQPPVCDENGENTLKRRRKRQTIEQDETSGNIYDDDRENLKVKVFSGLYVNEATGDDEFFDDEEDDIADEIVRCPLFHFCSPNFFCSRN